MSSTAYTGSPSHTPAPTPTLQGRIQMATSKTAPAAFVVQNTIQKVPIFERKVRPPGWTVDPEIQAHIDEVLGKN
jgi:hypothetical protein